MKLHELHARKLEATVQLIEDGVSRSENLLRGAGQQGIVRAVESGLSEGERAELLEKLGEFHAALRRFAERFALERRPLDLRQVLNAEFSSAWVMLENCRPKRMKGYGVPFGEAERLALEESLEELLARVKELRARIP
jgi:hypothetical protein